MDVKFKKHRFEDHDMQNKTNPCVHKKLAEKEMSKANDGVVSSNCKRHKVDEEENGVISNSDTKKPNIAPSQPPIQAEQSQDGGIAGSSKTKADHEAKAPEREMTSETLKRPLCAPFRRFWISPPRHNKWSNQNNPYKDTTSQASKNTINSSLTKNNSDNNVVPSSTSTCQSPLLAKSQPKREPLPDQNSKYKASLNAGRVPENTAASKIAQKALKGSKRAEKKAAKKTPYGQCPNKGSNRQSRTTRGVAGSHRSMAPSPDSENGENEIGDGDGKAQKDDGDVDGAEVDDAETNNAHKVDSQEDDRSPFNGIAEGDLST